MELSCDVVVCGAGTAGQTTAMAVQKFSNQNLHTIVLDQNSRYELGKKTVKGWSCGNATSDRSLDFYSKSLGITHSYPEIEHKVKGVICYSPDRMTGIPFEGSGSMLNRKLFPGSQHWYAEKMGVEFLYDSHVESLIMDGGRVVGVEGRMRHEPKDAKNVSEFLNRMGGEEIFRIHAKVVVDATGYSSPLRESLIDRETLKDKVPDLYMEKQIDRENDVVAIHRKIITFEDGAADEKFFHPDYAIIQFDPEDLAPGGYAWAFSAGKNKANVGIGVSQKLLSMRNQRLGKTTLKGLVDRYIDQNPVIKNPVLSRDRMLDGGNEENSWSAPVRRHNDCMVANGLALIGDSAWMPRPPDAGGLGNIFYAGPLLGKRIVMAIEGKDTSQASLWGYVRDYNEEVGNQMAPLQVLRMYLQTLTNEELNWGMKNLVKKGDINELSSRRFPKFEAISPFEYMILKLQNLFEDEATKRTMGKLVRDLKFYKKKAEKLTELYTTDLPKTPAGIPEWKKIVDTHFLEARVRFNLITS